MLLSSRETGEMSAQQGSEEGADQAGGLLSLDALERERRSQLSIVHCVLSWGEWGMTPSLQRS
jgi:hypothetical protein